MPEQWSEGEYGWLYGEDPAKKPAPKSTGSDLPPPNLPPPGGPKPPSGPKPPKQGSNARKWRRIVGVVALVWIIFLVAVPIWAWGKVTKVDAEPGGTRPADQPGTTYLLVGSDSRKGLTAEQRKQLTTGNASGARTDTILLLHAGSGPKLLMSIPRDSIVAIPGHGTTKINAAYAYGGPRLLVKTIENNTGIKIDDYVEIGFGGLVNVVDSVGGVTICPKTALKDKDSGLNVKKGCQNADGVTALAYSRARHVYATQDIQRVQSQREVLGSIASKVKSPWTVLNPFRYRSVASGAANSLQVGENVGPFGLIKFALALSSAMGGSGLNCTVPLRDFAVTWDPVRAPKMFNYIKTDRTADIGGLCTKDGLPKT